MRLSSLLVLLCAALGASQARGQSLAIIKKAESNILIEASAPAANPHTLQASANMHLWADVHDPVQGLFSSQLDGTGVSPRYFRLVPSSPPPPSIVVMLVGDSMVSDCCGWGGGMYPYFKLNTQVVNYGMPWTSSKTFLQSAEWDKMLLVKPNYVLIQFGYSDSAIADPDRYTTIEEFKANLRTIGQTVLGFNGVPIFVTLHAARTWDADGKLIPSWEGRNSVIKQVAAEMQTPLLDFYQLTWELFTRLGPSGTEFMHWASGAPDDAMHFSPAGALVVSRVLVNALPDNFGPYLTGIFDPPPLR